MRSNELPFPTTQARARARPSLGVFERYLTLWVGLCIVVGIAARPTVPGAVPG